MRINRIINHIHTLSDKDLCVLKWSANYKTENNLGDAINPILFNKIFSKRVISNNSVLNLGFPKVYSLIGSILDNNSTRNLHILGSGFRQANARIKERPSNIIATRGPLTREKFLKMGIKCPSLYGDPAILLPFFYEKPAVNKVYKVGVIPHYVDMELDIIKKNVGDESIRIISILSSVENFVDEISRCDFIVSSSLHGVIIAHAYGIPATWVEFSNNVSGKGFKFQDYFKSVNLNNKESVKILNPIRNKIDNLEQEATSPDLTKVQSDLLDNFKLLSV